MRKRERAREFEIVPGVYTLQSRLSEFVVCGAGGSVAGEYSLYTG